MGELVAGVVVASNVVESWDRGVSVTRMLFPLAAAFLALLPLAGRAECAFPPLGGYGFDWLRPATATCRQIGAQQLAVLSSPCLRTTESPAFGLPFVHYSCPLADGGELLIYPTRAQCRAALDAMQSHGP